MRPEKINNKKMKELNMRSILNMIRRAERISRIDLAKKTGLTTGTITNITNELIAKKFVTEAGSGESAGGRRPVLLEINAHAGYLIGMELNATEIICIAGDFRARPLDCIREKIDPHSGKHVIVEKMAEMLQEIIRKNRIGSDELLGIGLAVPGPCDYANGIMLNPPNFPEWINVPIREIISSKLGTSVYLAKETACELMGEYWIGTGSEYTRIMGIHIEAIGIGGSMIADGDVLLPGTENMDIGHTTVEPGGAQCSCGSRGCLEACASGNAAVRYAKEKWHGRQNMLDKKENISLDDVVSAASQGDPAAVWAVDRCARYIASALRNAICLLNPQVIYMGGEFVEKCPLLYERTVSFLENCSYPETARSAVKSRLTFGDRAGAMGGLALVFNALPGIM